MKIFDSNPGVPETLLGRVEADVAAKIQALFARCPALCGFAVRDRASLPKELDENSIPDADLFVTEIGIFPKLDQEQYGEIDRYPGRDEIREAHEKTREAGLWRFDERWAK